MAARLQLRRGTSASPSLTDGEIFLNYTTGTIQFASSSVISNLLPLDKSINGTIILDGNISASNLYLTGDITARDLNGRDIRLSGNIYLGDEVADNISVTAQFSGSLIPSASDSYNLGSDTRRWSEIHVSSAFADTATILDITLPSSRILSSSLGDYQDFDTFSGSVDTRFEILNSYTESTDQRLNSIQLFTESVDSRVSDLEFFSSSEYQTDSSSFDLRIDEIETTFSSSVDSRLDGLEFFSSSEYQTDSSSFDLRLIDLESTSSDQEPRIDSLEASQSFFDNTFSSSVDDRLNSLEIFSESLDAEFLNTNGDNVVSSSQQIDIEQTTNYTTFSSSLYSTDSGLDSRIITLETTFSSSVDDRLDKLETTGSDQESRLDELETIFSSSVDSRLDSLNLYTQSNDIRIDGIDLFTSSQESKNSTLETYTSSVDQQLGSIHSYTSSLKTAIDTSGSNLIVLGNLTVQGTQTSLNTSQIYIEDIAITLASGALDGSEANGAGIEIAGANQSLTWDNPNTRWVFTGQVSSSAFIGDGSSIENVTAANVEYSNVLNKPTLVSGSSQISFTGIVDKPTLVSASSQIDLTQTNNYISGVKDRLNIEGIISSSFQIISNLGGSNIVSSSDQVTHSLDMRYMEISGDNVFTGSSQVIIGETTGFDSFSSSLDTRFLQIEQYTSSNDIIIQNINDFTHSVNQRVLDEEFTSSQHETRLDSLEGPFSSSVNNRLDYLENYSSSLDTIFLNKDGDGVISGSDGTQLTASFDSRYERVASGDNPLISSSLYSTDAQGSFTASINGFDTNINLGVRQIDSPIFSSLTLTNLTNEPISSQLLQGVLYKGTGELVYSDFGDAIYYNVTQSADVVLISGSISYDSNDNILTAGAVKKYVDWRTEEIIDAIGAADITAVIAGDGISGGGLVGDVTMSLDTSSLHFTNGVVSSLPNGIISGSTFTTFSSSVDTRLVDLENFSSSLDDDFVTQTELASATSSLINSINEKLDTGSYNTDSQSFDSRTNSLESFSSSIDTTIKTELNTNDVISGSTGDQLTSSFDARYLNTNGDNVISGSSQITISDTTGYTTFSSSIDSRLVNQELFSSSIDGTIKNKLTSEGVISGSSQLTTEFDSRYLNTNGDNVVSGSSQIQLIKTDSGSFTTNMVDEDTNLYYTDVRVKTKLNTDGVISGSSQISFIDITDKPTLVSGSDQLTGSLVDLVSDQSIGGTKTFNNIVVNGTGSFSFIQSTTGSSTSIGEAFIVLNENTPSSNFAGIKVVDSGSLFTTASFIYDGQNNQWLFQHEGSEKSGSSLAIFGPLSQDGLGTEVGLTENKIPKALTDHGHHIGDSNITDTGTLITLGSNSVVTGTFYATGTTLVSGSSQITYSGISSIPGGIVSGSSQITYSDISSIPGGIVSGSTQVTTLLPSGTVSQSVQVEHDLTTGFVANEHIDHSTISITAGDGLTGGGNITTSRTINVVGTVDRISVTADAVDIASTYVGQSSITTLGTITTGNVTAILPSGTVSGSFGGDVTGNIGALTVGKIQGIDITSGEATQLANIDTTTISTTQWGYVGALNQGLTTTSNVQFGIISGSSVHSEGSITAEGDVIAFASSDRRLKDEITPITNSLQKINSIGGYSFVWNEKQDIYSGKDYGVIAQEIENILPELVETRENGYKAVKYDRLVSLLIEGIKELTQEVAELKRKLED